MLSRIEPSRYLEIKEVHHQVISQYPLINAVVSNIQAGFVYADASRQSFYIATKSGFSLFNLPDAGSASTCNHEFFEFLRRTRDIPDYIHIYRPASSFQGYIEANWDKYKIRERAQFRYHHKDSTANYERLLPPNYRIANIQAVSFEQLEAAFKLELAHRYWNSKEDFLHQAIGACILNEDNEPAAICYSACVVDGVAEMDTLVLPAYRGRRFMRIVSEPFFNLAIQRELTPHWDTFISNSASYIMAQKFELRLIQEYDLLSLLLR